MMYAEASYFDGYHFQHIAAYEEEKRLERIRKDSRKMVERALRDRRSGGRVQLPVEELVARDRRASPPVVLRAV